MLFIDTCRRVRGCCESPERRYRRFRSFGLLPVFIMIAYSNLPCQIYLGFRLSSTIVKGASSRALTGSKWPARATASVCDPAVVNYLGSLNENILSLLSKYAAGVNLPSSPFLTQDTDYTYDPTSTTGGFGTVGNPNSLLSTADKLSSWFGDFHANLRQFIYRNPFGFYIDGSSSVTLSGTPGSDRKIYTDGLWLLNSHYPLYRAALIDPRRPISGEPPEVFNEAFSSSDNLRRSIQRLFLDHTPANVYKAWVNMATQETPTTIDIPESTVQEKGSSHHFAVDAVVGIQLSRFAQPTSKFGSYAGLEIFGSYMHGAHTFQEPIQPNQTTYTTNGITWSYAQAMPQLRHQLNIYQRQAYGVTAFAGLALRKGWALYIPVSWKMGSFTTEFVKDPQLKAYTELPTNVAHSNGNVSLGRPTEQPTTPVDVTKVETYSTWKPMWEVGLGARLRVSKWVSIGMRWTTGFPVTLKFNTQPYNTYALHDSMRLGAEHTVKFQPTSIGLEFLFNLR